MKTSISCVLVALLLSATLSTYATNYYVDPSSSGSNQGTFTNPWKSITDIPWYVNWFKPGDTVFFKRGQQYTGTLSINSSGSDGSPIVFMPYGSGNAPVFKYDMANNTEAMVYNRVIIRLYQANYVVIDGFELIDPTIPETDHNVTANVGYGVAVYGGASGTHNIIKNLKISKLGAGVSLDGNFNTVTDCDIRNLRMILNTPDVAWDDFGANGVIISGSDNTITHNHIEDCWSNSYDYQIDGGAIEMYGAISNNKILYNTAIENLGFMEFGSGNGGQSSNNVVGYNLMINNGHVFWINNGGVYALEVRGLQFLNNNVVETHAHRLPEVRNLIGIMNTPSIANVLTMKNNIFWITTAMNITDPNSQPFNGSQLVHQSNLFHMGGGGIGFNLDATERNLNAGDQVFTDISSSNPALWNYNLRMPSAAIDLGQFTGILKDFYGQAVPSGNTPDVGIAENVYFAILPLQFLSINGWNGTNGNTVEWVTSTDTADHFEIEKSTEGINFKKIAAVPYKSNTGSSSTKYQFIDNDVTNGIQYYRIKVIEPGNGASYSSVVTIKNNQLVAEKIVAFPNPAQDLLNLKIAGSDFLNKEMIMVNMAGITVKSAKVQTASSQIQLNVSMLPKGVYAIKIVDQKTGKEYNTKFMK